MSTPVRLSNELLLEAREASARFHRSVAQQVEHWAQIGRAVEAVLAIGSTAAFKDLARQPDLDELIAAAETQEGRLRVLVQVRESGLPTYSADPDRHDGVLEHRPDGTSVRGRFANRAFVPPGSGSAPSAD